MIMIIMMIELRIRIMVTARCPHPAKPANPACLVVSPSNLNGAGIKNKKKAAAKTSEPNKRGRARIERTRLDSNGLAPQPSHAASRACSIARVSRVPRLRSITRTLATRKAPELVPNMSAILSPRFPCPAMAACCSFCLDSFKYPAGLAAAQRREGGRGPARVKGM